MTTAGSVRVADRCPAGPAPRSWPARTAVVVVATLLVVRIFLGIDLTDEAYYTSFVDGWLKTGIDASVTLSLHQTAALLVYPFAAAFAALTGGHDGLALFLRMIYLGASTVAALVFQRLVARLRGRQVAIFSALVVVSFIPFSLPAPSYNTLGMLAMMSALSSGALYFLGAATPSTRDDDRGRNAGLGQPAAAAGSALAWTLAAVAYPTLVAVQLAFVVGLACQARWLPSRALRIYLSWCAATHAVGVAVLLAVFGMDRLLDMLAFSNASLQVSSGLGDKLQRLATPFVAAPWFGLLCLGMLLLGLIAPRVVGLRHPRIVAAALGAALLLAQWKGPVLYATTHDLVLLMACVGLGLAVAGPRLRMADALPSADEQPACTELPRMLLGVGVVAGLVTTVTATNGLINFAVGGFFLAALAIALVLPAAPVSRPGPHALLLAACAAVFIGNAYAFIYGEPRNPLLAEPRRIEEGVFKNLLTSRRQADAIVETTRFMAEFDAPSRTLTVLGRLPGMFLLTRSQPLTLSTWDFGQHNRPLPAIERIRQDFYDDPRHRPDAIVVVADPWTRPPSGVDARLLQDYRPCRSRVLAPWSLTLHVRPDAPDIGRCDQAMPR